MRLIAPILAALSSVAVAGLVFVCVVRAFAPMPVTAAPQQAAAWTNYASNDREQLALDVAAALGNTQPSVEMQAALIAWQRAEGGTASFNPWNTTQDWAGATIYNSIGVRNYASREDGIAATVTTMEYGYSGYADIKAGIATNDVERLLNGIAASPWCPCNGYSEGIRTLYGQILATLQTTPQNGAQQATAVLKRWPTDNQQVNAHFSTVDCNYWGFQAGCQHSGTDLAGTESTPVYAPFNGTFKAVGTYAEGTPQAGKYIMYMLLDGTEMYFGHLRDVSQQATYQAGDVLGYMRGDSANSHWQCKNADGVLIDCEAYFNVQ